MPRLDLLDPAEKDLGDRIEIFGLVTPIPFSLGDREVDSLGILGSWPLKMTHFVGQHIERGTEAMNTITKAIAPMEEWKLGLARLVNFKHVRTSRAASCGCKNTVGSDQGLVDI